MSEKNTAFLKQKFENLFILYFPKVKNFALKLLKSDYEAEDIARDIFVKLWKMPEIWMDDCSSTDSYLYTMTRNYVFDTIKHKNIESAYKEKKVEEAFLNDVFDSDSPLDNLYCKEIQLLIYLTLEQMPEKRKKVFEMSRFEGMSNDEIAQSLNLSVRTVEHHIYLALSELKKILICAFFLNFL